MRAYLLDGPALRLLVVSCVPGVFHKPLRLRSDRARGVLTISASVLIAKRCKALGEVETFTPTVETTIGDGHE